MYCVMAQKAQKTEVAHFVPTTSSPCFDVVDVPVSQWDEPEASLA